MGLNEMEFKEVTAMEDFTAGVCDRCIHAQFVDIGGYEEFVCIKKIKCIELGYQGEVLESCDSLILKTV